MQDKTESSAVAETGAGELVSLYDELVTDL